MLFYFVNTEEKTRYIEKYVSIIAFLIETFCFSLHIKLDFVEIKDFTFIKLYILFLFIYQ